MSRGWQAASTAGLGLAWLAFISQEGIASLGSFGLFLIAICSIVFIGLSELAASPVDTAHVRSVRRVHMTWNGIIAGAVVGVIASQFGWLGVAIGCLSMAMVLLPRPLAQRALLVLGVSIGCSAAMIDGFLLGTGSVWTVLQPHYQISGPEIGMVIGAALILGTTSAWHQRGSMISAGAAICFSAVALPIFTNTYDQAGTTMVSAALAYSPLVIIPPIVMLSWANQCGSPVKSLGLPAVVAPIAAITASSSPGILLSLTIPLGFALLFGLRAIDRGQSWRYRTCCIGLTAVSLSVPWLSEFPSPSTLTGVVFGAGLAVLLLQFGYLQWTHTKAAV